MMEFLPSKNGSLERVLLILSSKSKVILQNFFKVFQVLPPATVQFK